MAGIIGIVADGSIPESTVRQDAWNEAFYVQHRAQSYCGFASCDDKGKLHGNTHKGHVKTQFTPDQMEQYHGRAMIGSVSSTREPVSHFSSHGTGSIITYDGNIINAAALQKTLAPFDGCHDPQDIPDALLVSRIIGSQRKFEKGVEAVINDIQGDFALVALTKDGVYAARGWGRKPLILGKKNGAYAVSSESNSFENTGFDIYRDVQPGEVVLLATDGIHEVAKFDLGTPKFGTFEWIYTAHPASIIDGRSVAEARLAMGRILAQKYGVPADIVSGIPNSGRWHGMGYAKESKIPYIEVFIRYDYADRSYTQPTGETQQKEADYKLIPVRAVVWGNRIIILDDSIVRGTQTKNQVARLRSLGAKEVHARIACPPLMCACRYGKTTKEDSDCVARRMSLDDIRTTRGLDTLEYAGFEDLADAIGKPLEQLCVECWTLPKDIDPSQRFLT